MVAKKKPERLPSGWTVQFKVQKSGRKVKIYTNLETGKEFFSKDDLLNYIKAGSHRSGKPHSTNRHTTRHAERTPAQLVNDNGELPKWLPKGWKVEVKTRKSGLLIGKEYKCYVNPFDNCKFYSKLEVFRYLKTVGRKTRRPQDVKTVEDKSCESKKKTDTSLCSTDKVVVQKCEVEDLPPGWTKEIRIRKTSKIIRKDPYYTDPVSGYIFRSKKAALHYVATGEISRHVIKPKNCEELMKDEIEPSAAAKRQKLEHPASRRQLFSGKMGSDVSDLEQSKTEGSKVSNSKRVSPEAKVTFSSREEIMQGKHSLDNAIQECVETKGECAPKMSSLLKAEGSKRGRGDKRSPVSDAVVSEKSQGRKDFAKNRSVSTPAPDIMQEKNFLGTMMEKSSVKEASVNSRKSKNKKEQNLPPRSSKRLAGQEPDQVMNLEMGERALKTEIIKFRKTKAIQDAGLASDDLADCPSAQFETSPETELADCASTKTNDPLHGDPSNQSTKPLGDQVAPEELHLNVETEKINDNPEPQLSFLFGSDPCLEFAFKTLLGELPLDDTPLEEGPTLNRAGSTLQDGLLENGVKKSSTGRGRVSRNKTKNKKELSLPRRSSKRLAGAEPEFMSNSLVSERALQNAIRKPNDKSITSPTNLLDEDNRPLGAGPEKELQTQLSNTDTSMRAEPLNEAEKSSEDLGAPLEKQQTQETQEAELEKLESNLSFSFVDYWSDPCLDFAFKTLTGVIPIEDSFVQGEFQTQVDISHNLRNSSLALPDFGSPSLFQTDISSQFDTPEKSGLGQQSSATPTFLPAGNVNFPSCSGVHSQQQCLEGNKDLQQKVKS